MCYVQSVTGGGNQINPLHPRSDKLLICPCCITPESHIRVTRIKKMINNKGSLQRHLRKCIENSMENIHTDVRV